MSKRLLLLLVTLLAFTVLLMSPANAAAQRAPMRVALLPVIDRTRGWLPSDDANDLLAQLEEQLHVPLNNTMQWVEYVPYNDSESALAQLVGNVRKPKYATLMQPLAERLSADLVLALVVESYYERIYHGYDGDLYVQAVVDMTMYGYDRQTSEVIRKSVHRSIDDDYGVYGNVHELASEAVDEITRAVAPNRRIMAVIRAPRDNPDAGKKVVAK